MTTTIYAIMGSIDYESSTILRAYSTHAAATELLEKLNEHANARPKFPDHEDSDEAHDDAYVKWSLEMDVYVKMHPLNYAHLYDSYYIKETILHLE